MRYIVFKTITKQRGHAIDCCIGFAKEAVTDHLCDKRRGNALLVVHLFYFVLLHV